MHSQGCIAKWLSCKWVNEIPGKQGSLWGVALFGWDFHRSATTPMGLVTNVKVTLVAQDIAPINILSGGHPVRHGACPSWIDVIITWVGLHYRRCMRYKHTLIQTAKETEGGQYSVHRFNSIPHLSHSIIDLFRR